MYFNYADHPIWNHTIDLVFDCYLSLGSQNGFNPILNRILKSVTGYSTAVKQGFSTDYRAFKSARNLLAQFKTNLFLAKDLGLLEQGTFLCLRRHLAALIPLVREL